MNFEPDDADELPKPPPVEPQPVEGAEGLPDDVKNGDPTEAPDAPVLPKEEA